MLGRLCTPPGVSPWYQPTTLVQQAGTHHVLWAKRGAGGGDGPCPQSSCSHGGGELHPPRGHSGARDASPVSCRLRASARGRGVYFQPRVSGEASRRGDFEADLEGWRGSCDAGKGRAPGQRRQKENAASLKVTGPPRSHGATPGLGPCTAAARGARNLPPKT